MVLLVERVRTLTFAINPDQQHGFSVGGQHCVLQRGFTLVELLVVLAIGAMLTAIVPVAYGRMHEGAQYRDAVRAIVNDLRLAHQRAVSSGLPVTFRFDFASRSYGIEGQNQKILPSVLEIKATVGQADDSLPNQKADFVFLPEGGSSGGTIILMRKSGAGVRIRVDWLLGQITQEPLSS